MFCFFHEWKEDYFQINENEPALSNQAVMRTDDGTFRYERRCRKCDKRQYRSVDWHIPDDLRGHAYVIAKWITVKKS